MKYKYIGTEEQLVERGFKLTLNGDEYINYAYREKNESDEYGIFMILKSPVENKVRLLTFNYTSLRQHTDITPYIQDLIDDGLVEVVE